MTTVNQSVSSRSAHQISTPQADDSIHQPTVDQKGPEPAKQSETHRANTGEAARQKSEIVARGVSQQLALQNKLQSQTSTPPLIGLYSAAKGHAGKVNQKMMDEATKMLQKQGLNPDQVVNTLAQLKKTVLENDSNFQTRLELKDFLHNNSNKISDLLGPYGFREISGNPDEQLANFDRAVQLYKSTSPEMRRELAKPVHLRSPEANNLMMKYWEVQGKGKFEPIENDQTTVMEELPDGSVYGGKMRDLKDAREVARNNQTLKKLENLKNSGPISMLGRVIGSVSDNVLGTDNMSERLAAVGSLGDAGLQVKNNSGPSAQNNRTRDRVVIQGRAQKQPPMPKPGGDPWSATAVKTSTGQPANTRGNSNASVRSDSTKQNAPSNKGGKTQNTGGLPHNNNPAYKKNTSKPSTTFKQEQTKATNTNHMSRPANEIDKEIAEAQKDQAKTIEDARRHLREQRQGKPISGVKGGSLADQLRSLADLGDEFAELLLRQLEEVQRRLRNLHREKGLLKGDPE